MAKSIRGLGDTTSNLNGLGIGSDFASDTIDAAVNIITDSAANNTINIGKNTHASADSLITSALVTTADDLMAVDLIALDPMSIDEQGVTNLIDAYQHLVSGCHPSWLPVDDFPPCADLASLSQTELSLLSEWLTQRHGVAHLSHTLYKSFWPGLFWSGDQLRIAAVQIGLLAFMRGMLLEVSSARVRQIKSVMGEMAYTWVLSQRRAHNVAAGARVGVDVNAVTDLASNTAAWSPEDWPLLNMPADASAKDILYIGCYALYRLAWLGGQPSWALLRLKWSREWANDSMGFHYPPTYSALSDKAWCKFASTHSARLLHDPQAQAVAQLWLQEHGFV